MELPLVLSVKIRVDLVVMAIKGYATLSKNFRTGDSPPDVA